MTRFLLVSGQSRLRKITVKPKTKRKTGPLHKPKIGGMRQDKLVNRPNPKPANNCNSYEVEHLSPKRHLKLSRRLRFLRIFGDLFANRLTDIRKRAVDHSKLLHSNEIGVPGVELAHQIGVVLVHLINKIVIGFNLSDLCRHKVAGVVARLLKAHERTAGMYHVVAGRSRRDEFWRVDIAHVLLACLA